jgi:hypothetical protein
MCFLDNEIIWDQKWFSEITARSKEKYIRNTPLSIRNGYNLWEKLEGGFFAGK